MTTRTILEALGRSLRGRSLRGRGLPVVLVMAAVAAVLAAPGCASVDRYTDAVRIKPDRAPAYEHIPATQAARDGRTLRGTVVEIQIVPRAAEPALADTSVLFLDSTVEAERGNFERIPLADVDLIARLLALPPDATHDNIDLFESFNSVVKAPYLRHVPVRDYRSYLETSDTAKHCDCEPLDLAIGLPELSCVKRVYQPWFVELRGAYAGYVEQPNGAQLPRAREGYLAEGAAGVRFGASHEWGAGLLYSTGIITRDALTNLDVTRPQTLLHLRYQSPGPVTNFLGICLKPFVYGDFGATIDRATINLIKFNLSSRTSCGTCGQVLTDLEASGELGNVDLSIPLTYGLGAGIDLPVTSFMDLSIDAGWRSIGFGEDRDIGGWVLPSLRRLNLAYLRVGLTF